MYRKTRYCSKYSAYLIFPTTFRVISRKIDWDSAGDKEVCHFLQLACSTVHKN